jgi:hypothetical protein
VGDLTLVSGGVVIAGRAGHQPGCADPPHLDAADAQGEETGEKRTFFRSVPVFDVLMTEVLPGMEPVPLSAPREPITGNSHARLLVPLEGLAGELGYQVHYRQIDGPTGGWCDSQRREIVVDEQLPANAQVRVLVPWRRQPMPSASITPSTRARRQK